MGAPFTITSVSNYNSNPPSDDGAQTASNRVQWSTQKTKLADPIKTAFDTSESNTSSAFGKIVGGHSGITSTAVDYTVTASDQGGLVKCTVSGKTITTPDATVVGAPFVFRVLNASTGNITLDGSGTQTIDGSLTITIPAGCGLMLDTDGTNWFTNGQNFNNASGIINFLSGLTLSTAGGTGTMGIAAGSANDSTNSRLMQLLSAYTKTTASWAVGTGNGGLDTGAIANSTWYHWFLIERTDTGVVDVIFSLSPSSPTLPTNYTLSRRIGSAKTDGSAHWVAFLQDGDTFLLTTMVNDANAAITTSASLITLASVPSGIKVYAQYRASYTITAASAAILLTSPDETDQSPNTNGPASLLNANNSSQGSAGEFTTRVNTSQQIRARTTSNTTLNIFTKGWIDRRGKDG